MSKGGLWRRSSSRTTNRRSSQCRALLEEEGHTVLTAHDGRAASALARQALPDLVLSDVMMPLIDGIRLSTMIRAEPMTREIVVILMSAAAPPDLSAVGAAAFLAKPFDLDQVAHLIARHLAS